MNKAQSFILFFCGILLGALGYWLASISFLSNIDDSSTNRIIASAEKKSIEDCRQIKKITDKGNIDIYCSLETTKTKHGASYKLKSAVNIKTNEDDPDKVVISVESRPTEGEDYITEATSLCTDCGSSTSVDVSNLADLEQVSDALTTQALNVLNREKDRVEEAVDEAYKRHQEKEALQKRIDNCEVSEESTIDNVKDIKPEEKVKCRVTELEKIEDSKLRAEHFHDKVKKELWYLASQDQPLQRSFFLSDYMRELNSGALFDQHVFSVRSAIDTVQKYNDLRLFMNELGAGKVAALNGIAAQMPFYFYTNDGTEVGRQDRRLLETAWNEHFPERPFPTYYSLSVNPRNQAGSPTANRRNSGSGSSGSGITAQQFRNIVNSPGFKKLYQ